MKVHPKFQLHNSYGWVVKVFSDLICLVNFAHFCRGGREGGLEIMLMFGSKVVMHINRIRTRFDTVRNQQHRRSDIQTGAKWSSMC